MGWKLSGYDSRYRVPVVIARGGRQWAQEPPGIWGLCYLSIVTPHCYLSQPCLGVCLGHAGRGYAISGKRDKCDTSAWYVLHLRTHMQVRACGRRRAHRSTPCRPVTSVSRA